MSAIALRILTIGITIPLWLIAVAGAWAYFDKSSAVRREVNRAVSNLVHSAELDAAKAREEALRKIIAEKERRAERDAAAIARFSELLLAFEAEKESLNDELAELAAQPAPDDCVVDGDLLERLRR